MKQIPLVIKVKPGSEPSGTPERWEDLTGEMQRVTRDIETQTVNEKSGEIGALVSGIPTPFARANMFKDALNYNATEESSASMTAYFARLVSEWRGFIACIALDYSRVSTERVWMAYSDGKDITSTANIYEPRGAFGNMLFSSKPLWCERDADVEHKGKPFIDIVKFDGKVVGGTSPESLLFTSVAYKVEERKGRPFVDFETGKFTDPIRHELDLERTLALYAYVGHLIEAVGELEKYYSYLAEDKATATLVPKYSNLKENLNQWLAEIEAYAQRKSFKLESASTPSIDKFGMPFSQVFNHQETLYYKNGVLNSKVQGKSEAFDPKRLLLDGDAEIARLIFKGANKDNIANLPVYVLKAEVKNEPGEEAYFSLPLSPLGVKVFGEGIGALMGMAQSSEVSSRLTAVYDPNVEKNNLEVKLLLVVDQTRQRELKETYTVSNEIMGNEIVLWPNFIAKEWTRYFLYSEIPHNTTSRNCLFKAVPFVGDELNDFEIISQEDDTPFYLAKDGMDQNTDFVDVTGTKRHLETSLHVVSGDAVIENAYKYEVYECNHPFKGLKLTSINDKNAGFLIIRYTKEENVNNLPMNMLGLKDRLKEVGLGVDFGSTNTSIAYCPINGSDTMPHGLRFTNRRVSLLRVEPIDEDSVATENRLLFFQSNPKMSNSIKSVLTLHDSKRIYVDTNEHADQGKEKEVKGGFPCFSNNLPVDSVSVKYIKLVGSKCGILNQVQNMKWEDDADDIAYKKAFLKTLLLHVYAELFGSLNAKPKRLRWSFPSSMSDSLVGNYQAIWNSLREVNPLVNPNGENSLTISDPPYALKNAPKKNTTPKNDPFGGLFDNNPLLGGSDLMQSSGNALDAFADNQFLNTSGSMGLAEEEENSVPDFHRDDENAEVVFNPVPLIDASHFNSMTEACAVANYLQKNTNMNVTNRDDLTLCFDIGGSTTDISALCMLSPGLTMIKQSSIRFAAQRVSNATRYSKNFRDVLIRTCDKYGYHIQGLNLGQDKYTPDTAAYYFEQIVDRLEKSQLEEFYRLLNASCKDLMCVDLYVTGLILYYAGILTRKLIKQVRSSKECIWGGGKAGKPIVNIAFAGKGSRIMEWLSVATNPQFANQYYMAMFIKGLGQNDYRDYISNLKIEFPKEVSDNVKFEVSKGLAVNSSDLLQPSEARAVEVIGESGYSVKNLSGEYEDIASDNSITEKMMKCIGMEFYGSSAAGDRFKDFCGSYYSVAQQYFNLRMTPEQFRNAWEEMNLVAYIKNMPEYQQALSARSFDFVAPILILEGMKFYDDFLLKYLSND